MKLKYLKSLIQYCIMLEDQIYFVIPAVGLFFWASLDPRQTGISQGSIFDSTFGIGTTSDVGMCQWLATGSSVARVTYS
jgi:hypothetical protein